MINVDTKIYIAGKNGMVGSACWRKLEKSGFKNLIGLSSKELDLRIQKDVKDFLYQAQPNVIINAAAKVGGIMANNSHPYDFLMDNLQIQSNLISAAHELGVSKFIFLGSSCIYPKFAKQPLIEDYLLTGPLEQTNEWYAIAKISGVKLIESLRKQYAKDYISLMPSNLYGPGDNFDLETSHVLPAMIRKFHEAKIKNLPRVVLWGTGAPYREFLHVDDLASAVVFALNSRLDESIYNVGYGSDISIKNLAQEIKTLTDYEGLIQWDESKPDGTPKKLLDSSRLRNIGWQPSVDLKTGITSTYKWFLNNIN